MMFRSKVGRHLSLKRPYKVFTFCQWGTNPEPLILKLIFLPLDKSMESLFL